MDVAYDHIQEEAVSPDAANPAQPGQGSSQRTDLGTEFKEAYQQAISSPWAVKLGGFFNQVKQQSASYYEGARRDLSAASAEASKGWTDLISHTTTMQFDQNGTSEMQASTTATTTPSAGDVDRDQTPQTNPAVPESLPADIVKEAETILSRFRIDAAARLKQIQQAEDAADAALERFGTNIKNFLRDAVTVAPPVHDDPNAIKEVLFESKDSDGKRVVHATRFDAQLHVIHSNVASLIKDPESDQYDSWKRSFDVDKETANIAKDLDKYDELRRSMDSLVPEQVSYLDFWTRYYFLRHVIETQEQQRRELLKGTHLGDEEEVAWDDDDDDDDDDAADSGTTQISQGQEGHASTVTLTTTQSASKRPGELLKPNEPRRSNEQSVADSDASYDIVSGATSRSPGTPREEAGDSKKIRKLSVGSEEDWE